MTSTEVRRGSSVRCYLSHQPALNGKRVGDKCRCPHCGREVKLVSWNQRFPLMPYLPAHNMPAS